MPSSLKRSVLPGVLKFIIPLLFFLFMESFASISIAPKFLFIDQTKNSAVLNVSNNSDKEEEVWIEFIFGYVTSDDSGRMGMYIDSTNADDLSIAQWLQAYPKRFVLGPGEFQSIRISVKPAAERLDGEYWSRILINSKPRNIIRSVNDTTRLKSGLNFITQHSIPLHYRKGNITTGVTVTDISGNVKDSLFSISMKLTRTGNASFWGTRNVKVLNENGKLIASVEKNLVVYKTMTQIDNFKLQDIPAGRYNVQVECVTKRSDIKKNEIIQALPSRASFSITIP